MSKSWIDSEDGKEAIRELSQVPSIKMVLREVGKAHTQSMVSRVLEMNLKDPAKDREMLIAKSELEGAQGMLKYFIELIEEASRSRDEDA